MFSFRLYLHLRRTCEPGPLKSRRQCGPVVRALALRSGDPEFKTHSDHSLNLILVVPSLTVNSQLVCLQPAGLLFCRFVVFHWP